MQLTLRKKISALLQVKGLLGNWVPSSSYFLQLSSFLHSLPVAKTDPEGLKPKFADFFLEGIYLLLLRFVSELLSEL